MLRRVGVGIVVVVGFLFWFYTATLFHSIVLLPRAMNVDIP